MAEVLTYTTLLADMRAYSERGGETDPTVETQLPRLISLAERKITKAIHPQGIERTFQSVMETGVSIYPKPVGWRSTVSMCVQNGEERVPIFVRSYEYLRSYWPDAAKTGVPKMYSDHGEAYWLVAPTPLADYPWEIKAYVQPDLLGNDNPTNWITSEAPELLIDAAMRELSRFLKDWQSFAAWDASFKGATSEKAAEEAKKVIDRSTERKQP